jgi:hypothetical protein
MKKLWILPIFVGGVLAGWLGRGNGAAPPELETSQTLSTKAARHREAGPSKSTGDPKLATFGKRMGESNGGEFIPLWEELSPSERRAAMESMATQAGLDQVKTKNRILSIMGAVLLKWVDADLEGALAAARGTSNEDLRKFMISTIMEQLVKQDPDKALALEEEFPQPHSRYSTPLAEKALEEKIKAGAAGYIGMMEKLTFSKGGSGAPSQFPADFDFRTVADGTARLMASRDGMSPPWFPTNFYSEWAKRDLDSVFDWWATHPSLPFNRLTDILSAMEKTSAGSSASWIAAKLNVGATRAKIIQELGGGNEGSLPLRIEAISMALPDARSSDAFLTDFLWENTSPKANRQYSMAFVVSSISSPQARLEAFQALKAKGGFLSTEQFTNAQFDKWGITRSEVEQIFKIEE